MLEHHTHMHAKRVGVGLEYVGALELDQALGADALNKVAHAVERAQERRLATARRPNEGRRTMLGDIQRDVLERLEVCIPEVEVLHGDDGRGVRHAPVLRLRELFLHHQLH